VNEPITVTITAEWGALYDTLLAIEGYAERRYCARQHSAREQQRYNDLAAVVLPLRDAVDGAHDRRMTAAAPGEESA
jgi:hypothetical protein